MFTKSFEKTSSDLIKRTTKVVAIEGKNKNKKETQEPTDVQPKNDGGNELSMQRWG
jgi:hypothetical protein